MIRRLFNNRGFIIGLAVCSGLLMVRTLAAPFLDEPDFSDVEDPEFYLDEADAPELVVAEATVAAPTAEDTIWRADQSVLSGQLTWNDTPARNPFSGGTKVPGMRPVAAPSSLPANAHVPKLGALVAGPDSLLAVLDNRIVREGDLVAGYEVTRIERDGVRIASATQSHWLAVSAMEVEVRPTATFGQLDGLDEAGLHYGGLHDGGPEEDAPADELAGLVEQGEPGG